MLAKIILCLGLALVVSAVSRPKYLIPCSKSHNFNECVIKNSKYAIPFLIQGDKTLKIPSLNPVRIESVELATNNLNLKMKDVKVYGLDKLKVLNVTVDFEKKTTSVITFVEKTEILANYVMTGRIILPINGQGPANIKMYNGVYQYDVEWELVPRNGKQYINMVNSKYDYTIEKATFDFQNLFNGDKTWGAAMNNVLNENWQQVNDDLKAPFLEVLLAFQNDIFTKIFSQIPYDEFFLD